MNETSITKNGKLGKVQTKSFKIPIKTENGIYCSLGNFSFTKENTFKLRNPALPGNKIFRQNSTFLTKLRTSRGSN